MSRELRSTRACIHLDALRSNLEAVRSTVTPGTRICAAVKADAYGHGAAQISRALREEGVDYLGVATPFEGREIRETGDKGCILLLGPCTPEEIPVALGAGLELMVTGADHLTAVESALSNNDTNATIAVHLKIDTGMGRVGCLPSEAPDLARRITDNPRLHLAGVATHFPVADSDSKEDLAFTRDQAAIFSRTIGAIRDAGIDTGIVHAANSGAVALSPELAFGMVRPGIGLYGYGARIPGYVWKPVMEFKTRISALRKFTAGSSVSYGRTWTAGEDTWIATLPVGYADGYPRLLSNRSRVLIGGRSYPVVGTICMDQCMVNLGPVTDVVLYDEAVLFGPDPYGPDAEELADLTGTISYEITCGISTRVPRLYPD